MKTFHDLLRYFRWWLLSRLRFREIFLLICLSGSLITAIVFFWTERNMWHSYELGRSDVVDSKFVLNDEDVRKALLGEFKNCESIGGFRCAPHLISVVNLQIDDRYGDLLASVELSGFGTIEQVRESTEPRLIGFGHRNEWPKPSPSDKGTVFLTGFDQAILHLPDSRFFPQIVTSRPIPESNFVGWKSDRVFVADGIDAWWFRPFGLYRFSGQFFLVPAAASSYARVQSISADQALEAKPLLLNAPVGYLLGTASCTHLGDLLCFNLHRSYGAMAFAIFLMCLCLVPVTIASRQAPGSLRAVDLLSTLVIYGAIRVTIVGAVNFQLLAPAFIDAFFGVLLLWLTYIYLRR